MPRHRQIDPPAATAAPRLRVPRLADLEAAVVPGLAAAVLVASAAAWWPDARSLLVAGALLTAAVALAVESSSRRRRALLDGAAATEEAGAVTGAVDRRAWNAKLAACVADPDSAPLTTIRVGVRCAAGVAEPDDLDRLLVVATVRWREVLRPGDCLARLGEGDFGVLLPGCEPRDAERVAARLREGVPTSAVAAVGVATWDGEEPAAAFVARARRVRDRDARRGEPAPAAAAAA